MSDLSELLKDVQPAAGETAPPPETTQKKRDRNKPVAWIPRGKRTFEQVFSEARKAYLNGDTGTAWGLMAEIQRDPEMSTNPLAKQLDAILKGQLGNYPEQK